MGREQREVENVLEVVGKSLDVEVDGRETEKWVVRRTSRTCRGGIKVQICEDKLVPDANISNLLVDHPLTLLVLQTVEWWAYT